MRVVAGTLGGRRFSAPPGTSTRPTSELVRAAVFNSLESRGLVEDAHVADLFAGSGALGIEALSRGAAQAIFVEADHRASAVLRHNLDILGQTAYATVVTTDVERWEPPPRLDLVLADPPYGWRGWTDLLGRLAMFSEVVVVAESDAELGADGWSVLAVKRHGGTVVTQLRPRSAP